MTRRMRRQVTFLGSALSAVLALPALAQDTGNRADRAADQIEDRAERQADRLEDRADRAADRLENRADRAEDRLDNGSDRSLDRLNDRSDRAADRFDRRSDRGDRMNDRGSDRDRAFRSDDGRRSDRWSDDYDSGRHHSAMHSDQYGSSYRTYGGTSWEQYPVAIRDNRARSASHPGYVPMGPNSTRITNADTFRSFGYGVVADSGYQSGPCYAPAETSGQAWRSDDQERMTEFREIRGEVLATRYDLRNGQEHLLVRVRPERSEQIHVIDLGPRDRLNRLNIAEGERITVFARPSGARGESYLVAREIRSGGEVVRIDIDRYDDTARLRGEPVSPDGRGDLDRNRDMDRRDRDRMNRSDRDRSDMSDQDRSLRDRDRSLRDQDRMDRDRSQQNLRDDAGRSQDNLREGADRARQSADDTADRARQSAQDAADSARQGAQDAADRARDATGTGQQNQSDTNR